jgi:hypothetical protein
MVNPVLMTSLKKDDRDVDPRTVVEDSEVHSGECRVEVHAWKDALAQIVATPSQRQEFHDRTEIDDDVAPRDMLDLDEVQRGLWRILSVFVKANEWINEMGGLTRVVINVGAGAWGWGCPRSQCWTHHWSLGDCLDEIQWDQSLCDDEFQLDWTRCCDEEELEFHCHGCRDSMGKGRLDGHERAEPEIRFEDSRQDRMDGQPWKEGRHTRADLEDSRVG